MEKKAQMQIQETIMVLFVFIIILLLGLIFFYKYTTQSILNENLENEKINFENMLITFPDSAELRCSSQGIEENCIDAIKLLAFKALIAENKGDYNSKFGFKNITIYDKYPTSNQRPCRSLGDLGECGVFSIYYKAPAEKGGRLIVDSPVLIYYPTQDKHTMGKMVVEWYL